MTRFAAFGVVPIEEVMRSRQRSYVAAMFWTLKDHRKQRAFNRWLKRVMLHSNG